MKKNTFFSLLILFYFVLLNINVHSQQCEVRVTDITYESANSLTFDVYLKNFGASNFIYSHGSLAWTIDPTFLNGGMPTFSLVPGYSDFTVGAQPPSALITSPNVLRTSSNIPGSNGTILPGQSLRLYRFRLQTSASSFASSNFSLSWKNSVTPYTRLFSWNIGTGLPDEISGSNLSLMQQFLVENFEYGTVSNPDLVSLTTNWSRHSGTQGPAYIPTSLSYANYQASGIGGSTTFTNGGSGINDGDINRKFADSITANNNVYAAFLVNLSSAKATADYFFHVGPRTIGTNFRGRVFARINGAGWSLGLSKSTETRVDDNTILNFNQTYLVVLKYTYSTGTASDDVVSLYAYESGIPASEPGSPTVTIAPTGSGTGSDPANIGCVAIRQGTNTPTGTIDGISVATTWSEIFPAGGSPVISVEPSTLLGFSYIFGGGPSTSQSYSLSGSDLTPLSGNISVAGSTNYEVSLNNVSFSSGFSVGYTNGTLAATPIYVRLKSGLAGGVYNNENISNSGGSATTQNVQCSGAVVKPEATNHVTNFAGVLGIPAYYYINSSWTDATGSIVPDGYLIRGSSINFDSIKVPIDGVPVSNSSLAYNVNQGLQAQVISGLYAGTTYYFKIYPYTNSGTEINYKTDGSVPQFSLITGNAPSLPIIENFNYATGSPLTSNGWIAHSGAGTNPILVDATPLSYSGYVNSGIGKSVTMTTSGEDDNRAFGSITSNSIYASFMINVTSAQLTGDYIFHFAPENSTSLYFAKVFVKKNAGDSLAFGVAKNVNNSVLYTPFNYSLNTTYLIAVKYTFNNGTTTDDEAKIWINPVLSGTEPTADVTQTDAGTDALSLGMFALRQGSTSSAPSLILGGLRIADNWIPGSAPTTFPLSVSVNNGWNMVSTPGLHPTNQNVTTWWSGKDPAAGVFRFSGGYLPVTTTTPGQGYWMKHLGANTYNTGDEWPVGGIQIVPNAPIAGATGWNLIGGYELSVLTANITTTPGGLRTGQVFGYSGGYTPATNLVPGYAYWIKLTAPGSINIPTSLAKGLAKTTEVNTSDWGKIIITDNSGISYTLYTVKGEVNLNDYELPPAPPTGMFDVRYGSGRYAEELSAVNQSIELNSLEYPVKVRVENADIRLQDGTGNGLNERLKSGEEVTISNSAINKLMVSGDVIPATYSLDQNYPNPFNPSTKIEFSIPEDVNNVTLTIYNALGQRVAELVNSKMEAGKYSYVWNASDVSTGLYIYELRTDKFVSVKKMMLLK